ncbi:ATP-binding cassette domain-containing protein [Agromyces tardus]|uniref:ATP-binding cassette domain-containing protein n=1 Tax=Agromyces tardus TaxID=2583849 RepID=UPI00360DC5EB
MGSKPDGGKRPAPESAGETGRATGSTGPSAEPAASKPAPKPRPSKRSNTNAASKRSAASRAASSDAASARGQAAKSARTPAASGAQSRATSAEARRRAAATRQQVAASITTDTTAAERSPRKPEPSGVAEAAAATAETAAATAAPFPAGAGTDTGTATPTAEHDASVEAADLEAADVEAAQLEAAQLEAAQLEADVDEQARVDAAAVGLAAAVTASAAASAALAPETDDLVEAPARESSTTEAQPQVEPIEPGEAVGAPEPQPDDRAVGAEQAVAVIAVAPRAPKPRKKRTLRVARPAPSADAPRVLVIEGLVKRFGDNTAVDGISLDVRAGSFYGIVGPNGAGKTTTLSMVTGLLRPDGGTVHVNGIDAWADPRAAKRATGVLPDRLRLFDRLTGSELLYYSGVLRGLDQRTVRERSADLAAAFGLEDALDRLVADYSAGMTKKVALACAMIHSPRLLVLDEPFESVDPVSAANLTDILDQYVAGGGTVLLSSHGMDLIERVCDSAAIIVGGRVLASGALDEVRAGQTLEDRFVELAGGRKAAEGMEWLHSFSD